MSFFNFCCPSKSKKSLAYISDWIDAHSIAFNTLSTAVTSLQTWKDTLNNDIVQIVEDIANTYDYASAIPQLTTMSNDIADLQSGLISLQTFLSDKADKVVPKAVNSIALLDSTGNLVDSGKTLKDILVRPDSIVNNTYGISIDSDGEASINVTGIILGGDFSVDGDLEIYPNNVPNIKRALKNPDTEPTYNSDNLITSKAVYNALVGKSDVGHSHTTKDIVGNFPKFIQYDGNPLDLDSLFSDINIYLHEEGTLKLCIKNQTTDAVVLSDILYSEAEIPRHLNTALESTVPVSGYVIFNIYKPLLSNMEGQPEHGLEHENDTCYFIVVEGIFSDVVY